MEAFSKDPINTRLADIMLLPTQRYAALQTFEIWKIRKIVSVILSCELNLMSPACRPNFTEVGRTTSKVERACRNNI
jgi:hypothetical protein